MDNWYDGFGRFNDFLKTVFGRDGANGMGGLNVADGGLKAIVGLGAARFTPDLGGSMYYSPSQSSDTRIETTTEWADLKSLAHEYTHGLEYFTHPPSGMTYQNQPGALMESTANILAEYFQKHLTGTNDWWITSTNFMHGSNEYFQGFQVLMSDPWQDGTLYRCRSLKSSRVCSRKLSQPGGGGSAIMSRHQAQALGRLLLMKGLAPVHAHEHREDLLGKEK